MRGNDGRADGCMTKLNGWEYRDAMGQFCAGVVVVASVSDGAVTGFTAQSFVSLSLEPPLIAVCPGKASTSWPQIRVAGCFCINVLGADQHAVSSVFAQAGQAANIGWRPAASGSPILDGVLAYVDCKLAAEHDAGDHTIAVGRVLDIDVLDRERGPLLFFRGGYWQLGAGAQP